MNALDFSRYNPNHLLSTSYDGSVRILDFETQTVELLFGNDDYYTNFHREVDANNILVSLGNSGVVGLIDRRVCGKDTSECVQYFKVSFFLTA